MSRPIRLPVLCGVAASAQPARIERGKRYPRLAIRNAMVVDGNATPASGPKDILIENGVIARIVPLDAVSVQRGPVRAAADAEIDAAGIPYSVPALAADIRELVRKARAAKGRT
jgi:hypothetical protein